MSNLYKGPEEKFCFECGEVIRSKAEICPKCGVRQPGFPNPAVASGGSSKRIGAILFAILLGGLGGHKFYLGKIGQGILYLLFCWTFIPALLGLIEGIFYVGMSDEEFARKYGI